MKKSLKERKESQFANIQKESAKLTKLSGKSINSSKQASIDNLMLKPARIEPKQQRNISQKLESDLNQQNSMMLSNLSNVVDNGWKNIASTKDSTDKENSSKLIFHGKTNDTCESSDEAESYSEKLRSNSACKKPMVGGLISSRILKQNIYKLNKILENDSKVLHSEVLPINSEPAQVADSLVAPIISNVKAIDNTKSKENLIKVLTPEKLGSKNNKEVFKSQKNIKPKIMNTMNREHKSVILKNEETKGKLLENGRP